MCLSVCGILLIFQDPSLLSNPTLGPDSTYSQRLHVLLKQVETRNIIERFDTLLNEVDLHIIKQSLVL